jgi:hypothetical protein
MKAPASISLGFAVAIVVLALQGCGTQSSSTGNDGDPVPTSAMHLEARVETKDDNVALVSIAVNDGRSHGVQYRLDGGDYFQACVASQCKNLIDDYSQLGAYVPFFPIGYANRFTYLSDTDYVLSFSRPDARGAPNTRVSLPQPFNIDTPAEQQSVSDGEIVLVSWSPQGTGDTVFVFADADCRHTDGRASSSEGVTLGDTGGDGRESLRIDDLIAQIRQTPLGFVPIQSCTIDIDVIHERRGRIDPEFRGGYIFGSVSRKVRVNYVPSR